MRIVINGQTFLFPDADKISFKHASELSKLLSSGQFNTFSSVNKFFKIFGIHNIESIPIQTIFDFFAHPKVINWFESVTTPKANVSEEVSYLIERVGKLPEKEQYIIANTILDKFKVNDILL